MLRKTGDISSREGGVGRRRHKERGASAVEFAIVLPVLLTLVFGIIDYGALFFDSIGLKQGSREGARQAAVVRFDPSCSGTSYAAIACSVVRASDNVLGQGTPKVRTKVRVVNAAGDEAPWAVGNQLWVCAQTGEKSLTGFVPFPANGIVTSRTVMYIEKDSPVLAALGTTFYQDTAPTGGSWTWCA